MKGHIQGKVIEISSGIHDYGSNIGKVKYIDRTRDEDSPVLRKMFAPTQMRESTSILYFFLLRTNRIDLLSIKFAQIQF